MFISELSAEPEKFEEMMEMATERGSAERVEFPLRHKNGDIVYCDVYLITLKNTKGQRVGTVGVCKDITKWKRLQDELIRIDRKEMDLQSLVHRKDCQIQVSIQDNGIGITEDNKEKIFNIFFSTKPLWKGTGLGLSICQDIVKKLGGRINFKSEYGRGTIFTVTIPES